MRNNISPGVWITGLVPALVYGAAEAVLAFVLTWSYLRFIILTFLFWAAVGVCASIAFGAKRGLVRLLRGPKAVPPDARDEDLSDLLSFNLVFVVFVHEALAFFRIMPGSATDRGRLIAFAILGILALVSYRILRARWKRARTSRQILDEGMFLSVAAVGLRVVPFRLLSPEFSFDRWTTNALVQMMFLAVLFLFFLVPFGRTRRARALGVTVSALLIVGAVSGSLLLKDSLEIGASESRIKTPQVRASGPDIVILMLDTARAADMSLYGFEKPTTPRLVELAKDSVLFRNAISVTNWTVPSHASLFTGLVPSVHGSNYLRGNEEVVYPLETGFPTLAALLRESGYSSAAVVANSYYISPRFGLTRGFSYVWAGDVRDKFFSLPILIERLAGQEPRTDLFKRMGVRSVNTADVIRSRVFRWLDRRRHSPVFVFANFMEPHGIESLPRRWIPSFAARPAPLWPRRNPATGSVETSEAGRAAVRSWYDEELAYLDFEIGGLIDDLTRRRLYENTLIVVTSDHGELLGEHQELGHGMSLAEEILRVPLLVKYPGGRRRGEVRDAPVQTIDLFAEILAQAGVETPAGVQGREFDKITHAIAAEAKRVPYLAARWPKRFGADAFCIYSRTLPGFKIVSYSDGRAEIYDLRADPGEAKPVDDAALRARLEEEAREYRARMDPLRNPRPDSADAGRLKRLRSLGYIR
jgi:arylsulfatase A-like enzyme